MEPCALHFTCQHPMDEFMKPFDPEGMPAAQVLTTGKPVVAYDIDSDRFTSPILRRLWLWDSNPFARFR